MRTILAVTFLLVSSIGAFATSYAVQGGFFDYTSDTTYGYWTPRMMQLNVGGGTPNEIPFKFNSWNIAVSCSPMCAVGNLFSISLSMTDFVDRKYGGLWSGSLDFITQPAKLTAQSGIEIVRFVLTRDLSGCYFPVNCIDITPNLHGYVTVSYSLVGGQLQISSMSYAIPEPATLILLGTGLLSAGLLRRRQSHRV